MNRNRQKFVCFKLQNHQIVEHNELFDFLDEVMESRKKPTTVTLRAFLDLVVIGGFEPPTSAL